MIRRLLPALAALAAVATAAPASAQSFSYATIWQSPIWTTPINFSPTWKCVKGGGGTCTNADLANPAYKQVMLLPAGFGAGDKDAWWGEFDRIVNLMTTQAGTAWSQQKKSQLLFIGYFVAGGAINATDATFGAKIAPHPVRGYATSLRQDDVYAQVDAIRASTLSNLRPLTCGVLFNTYQTGTTANAAPPGFIGKPYGVAKFTRNDLNERAAYLPVHELAHAGLNFYDEYREPGFEELNIRQLDVLTPLALFDGSWGSFVNSISDLLGVYDYNISEILADSGSENIALSPWRATVWTPGYTTDNYANEGGMFFGRGTWHMDGDNVMNAGYAPHGVHDGFAWAHTASQQRVVDETFDGVFRRPNDRIRAAGPKNGWPLAFGSDTHVMMFDADKHHHVRPTQSYNVQVGWYDRQWKTCWKWGFIPYPCYDDVWKTAETWVGAERRTMDLKMSFAYGLVGFTQNVLCAVGVTEIPANGQSFRLCDQNLNTIAENFLPTVKFQLPYQDAVVPASQWMTTYWWRFRSWNGQIASGFTGWSSFYRSF